MTDAEYESIWMRPERPARGPKPAYSRAQITEAAIRIADTRFPSRDEGQRSCLARFCKGGITMKNLHCVLLAVPVVLLFAVPIVFVWAPWRSAPDSVNEARLGRSLERRRKVLAGQRKAAQRRLNRLAEALGYPSAEALLRDYQEASDSSTEGDE